MVVGYIRMEGPEEDQARERALRGWGAEKIIWEKASQQNWRRPAYEAMTKDLQPGDTVVVSRFSQLAAGTRDILVMVARLGKKQVAFASLEEEFYTATDQGRETLRILTALAEIEEAWLYRRQVSVQKAKAAGLYKGRTPLHVDEEEFRSVCARWRAGEMTAVAAMNLLGLKPNTFYRRVRARGL